MPVVFRCFYCRGKLSIARRKAGQDVECPRCQAIITVPAPDDLGDELTQLLTTSKEHAVVGAAAANDDFEAAAAAAMDGVTLPMPLPPPPVRKPARSSAEMPLFEAEGIEQLLASKIGPEPLPLPRPTVAPPVASDFPSMVTEDAFVISRAKATLLMIGAVLAIGLAFAAGFVVRGW